jgi:hypothetical protein
MGNMMPRFNRKLSPALPVVFLAAPMAQAASREEIDAGVREAITTPYERSSDGWKAGVDGSVALATLGAGGEIDAETAKRPIIGFIFPNEVLMYKLTFEGSKITEITK